jgi:hypothetical protein
VPERFFTPAEANELLPTVRPIAERMVSHRKLLLRALRRRTSFNERIAGNGGDLSPQELRALDEAIAREAGEVTRSVEALHALGVVVKDLDDGLVDFPARRGVEEVLLCWRVGEDDVAHWHGLEEGFAGRKPLPLD